MAAAGPFKQLGPGTLVFQFALLQLFDAVAIPEKILSPCLGQQNCAGPFFLQKVFRRPMKLSELVTAQADVRMMVQRFLPAT